MCGSRFSWIALCLSICLLLAPTVLADAAMSPPSRLVLYEVYLNPGCGHCVTVAPEIDQLRRDYQGRAIFLEQRPQSPMGDRYSRFWAAYPGSYAGYPIICIDSGYRIAQGTPDEYYQVQKTLVDEARQRPAQAEMSGDVAWRNGGVRARLAITNTSTVVLSYLGNRAQTHLLVYEQDAGMTGNLVRGVQSAQFLGPLPPGGSAEVTMEITGFPFDDPTAVRCAALIDYRPAAGTGPYDMLQSLDMPIAGLLVRQLCSADLQRL